jgi:hypothetical protein
VGFNPLRNEADAFKVLLIVAGIAAVIALLVLAARAIF